MAVTSDSLSKKKLLVVGVALYLGMAMLGKHDRKCFKGGGVPGDTLTVFSTSLQFIMKVCEIHQPKCSAYS